MAHVEAGLRSFNRAMPEEVNRVVTDHVATWLYAPSPAAVANLAHEGLEERTIATGDVMFDVLAWVRSSLRDPAELLDLHGLQAGRFVFATVHRAENTDDRERLAAVITGLRRIVDRGWPVLFAMHPRTAHAVAAGAIDTSGLTVVGPAPYRQTVALVSCAAAVATDSGGLQKEARWLGVPCITIRDETEWVETLDGGWNRLTGADPDLIVQAMSTLPAGSPQLLEHERPAADDIVRHLQGVIR